MTINYKKIAEANIKRYGTDIDRFGPVLLAHLYSDRTHFIYEILQNAEDAGAKAIEFQLFKDRLEVCHNGRLFNIDDVRGICGLVEGTKKDDLTQIGKFGIGFKSVYAFTNTPKIYSGDETFCIKSYVLPRAIKNIDHPDNETMFVFPFDHAEVSPEQSFKEIARRLRDVGIRTTLFLNHVEEIYWHIDGEDSGNYLRDVKAGEGHKKVYVMAKAGEKNVVDEEWLVFEKVFKLTPSDKANIKVEVAFKIEKDKNDEVRVVSVKNSKLIVFFPTEKPTYLKFLIQGPYKTTPNRENIPLYDKQNKIIVRETGELIAASLTYIKELGYLDVNLLNALPIDSSHIAEEPIYAAIFERVKEKLLSDEELLPAQGGGYTRASDALLARGKDLTEILDPEDTELLFARRNWLSTDITYDRTREIRDYLIDGLGVKEVDFEEFARHINSEFLAKKNDNWMIDFYSRLLDHGDLWRDKRTQSSRKGFLRTKPIVRLTDNKHVAPYDDDGNLKVFLPTGYKSAFKTIKKELVDDKNSLKFLKELGLHEPDLFAEINEKILPKYLKEQELDEDGYLGDFKKILTFINETESVNKKNILIAKLSEACFILSTEGDLKIPGEMYLNSSDLKEYFEGCDSACFVSEKLCERFEDKSLVSFLMAVGVQNTPRRKKFDPDFSSKRLSLLRKEDYRTRDIEICDYNLEGLDNFLSQDMSLERSLVVWKLILKSLVSFNSWDAKSFFEGVYRWKYYNDYSAKWDSAFLKELQEAQWLVSKDEDLKKASDITLSELADVYPKEIPNISVLIEKLHFKPDVFDQLPDDLKSKFELTKERSLEEMKEAFALFDKQGVPRQVTEKEEDSWMPDYEPDEINVEAENVNPDPIESPDLKGQGKTKKEADIEDEANGEEKIKEPIEEKKISSMQKKEIGNWGERSILRYLRRLYQNVGTVEDTAYGFYLTDGENVKIEVVWLNIKSEIGKGYDFVIRKGEEEAEYIEVKTKTGDEEELIQVTGTQWEFARKLFDQNEGEKYWIYVVINAGRSNAKIKKLQNPIRLWKGGKLYAHPIHFKL